MHAPRLMQNCVASPRRPRPRPAWPRDGCACTAKRTEAADNRTAWAGHSPLRSPDAACWAAQAREACTRTASRTGVRAGAARIAPPCAGRGPACPPPCQLFSDFVCVPVPTPILGEKVRKLEADGDPKILQNPQNSSKVLPKVPSGKVLYADPEKQQTFMILGYPTTEIFIIA